MLDFNDAPRQIRLHDPAAHDARLEHLRATLRSRARELVEHIFPAARIQGGSARIGDITGARGESLSITLTGDESGLWFDHAADAQGGDLIDLWRATTGADFPAAIQQLEEWCGIGTTKPRFHTAVHRVSVERKAKADREPKIEDSLGPPVATYHYLAADDQTLLGIVRRYHLKELDERGRPKKTFRPTKPNGDPGMPDPRPLMHLAAIATASEVVLVEGEKCAVALGELGIVATTQMGGAKADPAKTDWSPLAGKSVIVWEDNDTAGEGLTERVRSPLEAIGCSVRTVTIPEGKPAKWDAADAVEAGEDVAAIVATAREAISSPSFKFNVTFFDAIPDEHHKTWLIRDLFGDGEFTIVYGAPGCGKSVLIGDAAAHVATGRPWFGHKVRQCAVLYVAAERHALVKRRLAAWRRKHGPRKAPLVVLDGLFNLATDPAHAQEIVRIAQHVAERTGSPVGWIIIDTKAQVMGGGDENASKDTAILNNNVALLQAATRAHVTVIDHTPQSDPKRMKGNGGLAGAADGSFLVQRESNVRTLSIGSKAPNDGPDDISLTFKLDSILLGENAEGDKTTAPVVVPCEHQPDERLDADIPLKSEPPQRLGANQRKVLTALERAARDGQGLAFVRIKIMTDLDNGTLGSVLRKMIAGGRIIEKPGDPTTYWLP